MSPDPLREPWRSALEPKGVRSKRGLATKAGISPQTAKRLIDGDGSPSPETVAAVAHALFNGDRTRVWELAGHDRQDHGDWQLPPEASQLNQEQRDAVLAVVRAMLPSEAKRGDGDVGRDSAPMKAVPLPMAARTTKRPTAREREAQEAMRAELARRAEEETGDRGDENPLTGDPSA